jgi:hypothetical protein
MIYRSASESAVLKGPFDVGTRADKACEKGEARFEGRVAALAELQEKERRVSVEVISKPECYKAAVLSHCSRLTEAIRLLMRPSQQKSMQKTHKEAGLFVSLMVTGRATA